MCRLELLHRQCPVLSLFPLLDPCVGLSAVPVSVVACGVQTFRVDTRYMMVMLNSRMTKGTNRLQKERGREGEEKCTYY